VKTEEETDPRSVVWVLGVGSSRPISISQVRSLRLNTQICISNRITRAVWKARWLAEVRRYYAEWGGDCYAKL